MRTEQSKILSGFSLTSASGAERLKLAARNIPPAVRCRIGSFACATNSGEFCARRRSPHAED